MQTLVLVVSELASTAIQQAGTPSVVLLTRCGEVIRAAVSDHSPIPPARRADAIPRTGWQLVTALARDWGWSVHETGKIVWADVRAAVISRGP